MEEKYRVQDLKWQGKVSANLIGPTPDQAWSHLQHFCSLHKWVPTVDTCYKLEGVDDQPGCVRYCSGSVNRSDPTAPTGWSKERLLTFDPAGRTYSYEVVEANKGFGRYVAAIAVVPDPGGCLLEWSFAADPIQGWTVEGFGSFLEELAQAVAEKVVAEVAHG